MASGHPFSIMNLTASPPGLLDFKAGATGLSLPDSPESGVFLSPTSMRSASVSSNTSPCSISGSPEAAPSIEDFSDLLLMNIKEPTPTAPAQRVQGKATKSKVHSNRTNAENRAHPYIQKTSKVSANRTDADKPAHSYVALITKAILSVPEKQMILGDIYQYIMDNFPYYNNEERAWRNSIRHNLSLNECFVKSGRADNGKGHYWSVHPNCIEDFSKGDYRRRQARRRARGAQVACNISSIPYNYRCNAGYVPMSQGVGLANMGYNPYALQYFGTQHMNSYAASNPMMTRTPKTPLTSSEQPSGSRTTPSTIANTPLSQCAQGSTSMGNYLPPATAAFSMGYPGYPPTYSSPSSAVWY